VETLKHAVVMQSTRPSVVDRPPDGAQMATLAGVASRVVNRRRASVRFRDKDARVLNGGTAIGRPGATVRADQPLVGGPD
jgi:hypothetical protein